jgi:hypothetical protein
MSPGVAARPGTVPRATAAVTLGAPPEVVLATVEQALSRAGARARTDRRLDTERAAMEQRPAPTLRG